MNTYTEMSELLARAEKAEAELKNQRELHGLRLAAISTASVMNRQCDLKSRIDISSPHWSGAYVDVCVAVNREIAERRRAEAAEAEVAILLARLRRYESTPPGKTPLPHNPEGKSKFLLLESAARPLVEYLRRDCHPHAAVIVTSDFVDLVETKIGIPFPQLAPIKLS